MPFYEFDCLECEALFEFGTNRDIDVTSLWCVDCGSRNIRLVGYDEELNNRISTLISDVAELTDRVEQIEWYMDDDKSNTPSDKKTSTLKN